MMSFTASLIKGRGSSVKKGPDSIEFAASLTATGPHVSESRADSVRPKPALIEFTQDLVRELHL